jgi:hypothetical protein
MQLSDDALDRFIKLWAEVYGEQLDRAEAREIAVRLVQFYRVIGRFPPTEPAGAQTGHEAV